MSDKKTGLEGISKKLHDLWYQTREDMNRKLVIGFFCITNGWVEYSAEADVRLCDSPECSGCSFRKEW